MREKMSSGISKNGIEVTRIRSIDKLKYLKAYAIDYKTKSGREAVWEIASRGSEDRLKQEIFKGEVYTDGAVIFASNKERSHVVLLKEFRVSSGHYLYMLPAGLSEENEAIEAAAVREFKEETGLELEVSYADKPRYVSVGIVNERVTVVYGYYSGKISVRNLTDEEDADVLLVDREKAKEIIATQDVCLRTTLLLQSFFGLSPF